MNQPITGEELLTFFKSLDEYTPTLPDALTAHYLSQCGLHTSDPRLVRLVSLAAQKFLTDIATDALSHRYNCCYYSQTRFSAPDLMGSYCEEPQNPGTTG